MAVKYTIEETETEVTIYSLSFGYMYDIEEGVVDGDNLMLSLMDATDLGADGVRKLRRPDALEIWRLIKVETYPELFDDEGNEIEQNAEDMENTSKKKV